MTDTNNTTPPPPDFPVTWDDPAEAEWTWDWDDMHMPYALRPLAADYIRTLGAGFNTCYEVFGGFPQRWHVRIVNAYAYFAYVDHLPADVVKANTERWVTVMRERADVTEPWWSKEVVPELRVLERQIREVAVEDLSGPDLADAWASAWAAVGRMWQLHFMAILGPYQILDDLADLYEAHVPDAQPGDALRLIQGTEHVLLDVAMATERLAAMVAANSELSAIVAGVAEGRATMDALAAAPDGAALRDEISAFLAEHGHLGQAVDDLAQPSWGEEPAIFLAELAKRAARPTPGSADRRRRLEALARAQADEVRARLGSAPDVLARFEGLLALARSIGPLTEVHNYWIDRLAQARIRALAMRVGARLAAHGVLEIAEDVLYLHRDEVGGLLQAPTDARALVQARRAEHARQAASPPPRTIGRPPTAPEPSRFDGPRLTSDDPRIILGTGASAGIVRGTARLTFQPSEFARIQAGDIIVCPSSNPSWVPVFEIAGGLVTNTGGVLSHAAVVAREFGLPAVVGTGDATTRIADGQMLEIDGTLGIVRLL